MTREIPGYRYDPETKRYFKEDKNAKRQPPPPKDARTLAQQLWRWHQDQQKFRLASSSLEDSSLTSTLASFELFGNCRHMVTEPRVKLFESAYPVWWDSKHENIGLYFQSNRLLRRLDITEGTVTSPVFDGDRNTLFQQSNYQLCTAAFKHGLLLCSFRDSLEDMWEVCLVRFENFENRTEYTCTEARIRRDDIGGPFQAAEIFPELYDSKPIFMIGIGNRLIKGHWDPPNPYFTQAHDFKEAEEILSIKSSPDGKYAFVSCSGGAIYKVSRRLTEVVGIATLEQNKAARSIVHVDDSMRATVVTFHDDIFEIDFSSMPARQCAHSIALAPFKDPSLGSYKVAIGEEGTVWAAQIGSDHVSAWRWSSPSQPAQTLHIPGHHITDIHIRSDGQLLILGTSK